LVQGIVAAGGIFNGSNPSYTDEELIHQIAVADAKFIVTGPEMLGLILTTAKKRDIPVSRIWVFDNLPNQEVTPGMKSWQELLSHGEQDWIRLSTFEEVSKTTACRLMSSGTTWLPKAVNLTHYNLVAQHIGVMKADRRPYERRYVVPLPIFLAAVTPLVHFQNIMEGNVVYCSAAST
jgi:acyl-CoA synthetase (AMP-forming)/AMP-acid ligase II